MFIRASAPPGLFFFTADTGLGKTSGFQNGIRIFWGLPQFEHFRFLVLVTTKRDADKMYRDLNELIPGKIGIWTESHDPERKVRDEHFEPAVWMVKSKAARFPCLILTHNAGRVAEDWVGHRDMVLIDEYPNPVEQDSITKADFNRAHEAASRASQNVLEYAEALQWAEGQDRNGYGPQPVSRDEWVDRMIRTKPLPDPHCQKVHKLACAIKSNRAFQTWRGNFFTWTYYEWNQPFLDKAIVFSATASTEGWMHSPAIEIEKDGIRVDYCNLKLRHIAWPKGVSKYVQEIPLHPDQLSTLRDHLTQQVGHAGPETLFVAKSDIVEHVRSWYPEASITNWGRDRGSNEYRECTRLVLLDEFHLPKDAYNAHSLGHAQASATYANLHGRSDQTCLMKDQANSHLNTWTKQMVARGNVRNINEDGTCGEMEVLAMIDRDRYIAELPKLFPGCVVEQPTGTARSLRSRKSIYELLEVLPQIRVGELSLSELKEQHGLDFTPSKKRTQLEQTELPGWRYCPGGKGKGNGAKLLRMS